MKILLIGVYLSYFFLCIHAECTLQVVPFDLTISVCNETTLCTLLQTALLLEENNLSLNTTIEPVYLLENQRLLGMQLTFGELLVVDKYGPTINGVSKLVIFDLHGELGSSGGTGDYFIGSTFNGNYIKQPEITPASSSPSDQFGRASSWIEDVDEDRQFLAVLIASDNIVSVFETTPSAGLVLAQTIDVNDDIEIDNFSGSRITGYNDQMAIGYPSSHENNGSAIIYTHDTVTWTFAYSLGYPQGVEQVGVQFGIRVVMFDNILLVSDFSQQVHVYLLNDMDVFTYSQTLQPINSTVFFGLALSLWDEYAAILAFIPSQGGVVNIFKANATDFFTLHQQITRPGGSDPEDLFGFSVDQYEDYLITADDTEEDTRGLAYLYKRDNSTNFYNLVIPVRASDGIEADHLGKIVAINEHGLVVGRERYMKLGEEVVNVYEYPQTDLSVLTTCDLFSVATEEYSSLVCRHVFSENLKPAFYELSLTIASLNLFTNLNKTLTTAKFLSDSTVPLPMITLGDTDVSELTNTLIIHFSTTEKSNLVIETTTYLLYN